MAKTDSTTRTLEAMREHNSQIHFQSLQSVLTVSLETMKIVNSLPALNERQPTELRA